MQTHPDTTYQFGRFEVNADLGELLRDGKRVRLQEQPFRLLVVLLEKAGEVVSREELRSRIWPEDTFVDFDGSLRVAIGKLREALGDDADSPRYIETVPKRGYRFLDAAVHRFICPVESLEVLSPSPISEGPPAGGIAHPVSVLKATATVKRSSWLIMAIAALGLLGTAVWFLRQPLPPPRIADYARLTNDGMKKLPVGTEGNRLYMNVWYHLFLHVALLPISGGEISEFQVDLPNRADGPFAFAAELEDVSPDGSSLLVFDHMDRNGVGNIWVVGSQGRPARYLTRASHAAWSPDGKSVVFSGAFGDFHLIPSEGGKTRLLVSVSQQKAAAGVPAATPHWLPSGRPEWSPDGRTIRFTWNQTIWEMSSDGANLHQLLPKWRPSSFKCCGQWTPDGQFYIFRSGDTLSNGNFDPGTQLFALDERRDRWRATISDPIQLTSGPILWNTPVPSRDGRKIFAEGINPRGVLVRYYSEFKELRPYLGGISAEYLSFSSDGKSVAYVSYPDGILFRANRDGSGQVQLTKPHLYPKLARWSPDGSQILFEDDSPTGVYAVYLIPIQGGAPTRIFPDDNNSQTDANWSPDGKNVVFASAPVYGSGSPRDRDIRVLDLVTRKATRIPGSEGDWSPRWSPDGRHIAALTSANGIAVFDLESRRWTALEEKECGFPTFSHDGRWIYFLRFSDSALIRVPVSGGTAEVVVDLKDFRLGGFWGFWMGLDPTDAPLLLREEGTDEIYALTLDRK